MITSIQPYVLATHSQFYKDHSFRRPTADPLGFDGLPITRAALDGLVDRMTGLLAAAGPKGMGGHELARRLDLSDTRRLRHLVAYARVHRRIHQIIGAPGRGYFWGDCRPGMYAEAIADATRRGRCYFFIAALIKRQGAAIAAAQLALNFVGHNVAPADRHNDELAALVASEGCNVADFFDAVISELAATDEGRAVLAGAAAKHAELLIPADAFNDAMASLDAVKASLTRAARPTHSPVDADARPVQAPTE